MDLFPAMPMWLHKELYCMYGRVWWMERTRSLCLSKCLSMDMFHGALLKGLKTTKNDIYIYYTFQSISILSS